MGASSAGRLGSGDQRSGGAGGSLADLGEAFLEAIRAHPVADCGRVNVPHACLLGSRGDLPIAPSTYHHDNKEVVASWNRWHSILKKTAKRANWRAGSAGSRGGAGGNRTPDLLNAIQALSQLSYSPDGSRKLSPGLWAVKSDLAARSRRNWFSQTRGGAEPSSWYVRPPARRSGGTGIRRALKMPRSLRPCGFESHLRHHCPVLAVVELVSG